MLRTGGAAAAAGTVFTHDRADAGEGRGGRQDRRGCPGATRPGPTGLPAAGGQAVWGDTAALLLIGPAGALGTTSRMARTLEPLAAGGRYLPAVLMAAGGWQVEAAFREAMAGLEPKLAILKLRICRRKAGIRMAKVRVPAKT